MNIPTRIASRFSTGINACQYRIGATILLSGPFRPVRQAPRHTPAPSVSRHPTPSPIPLAASKAPRKKNKMGVVAKASASAGAAGRGVKIPGNTVLMLFRNDYAVSMLAASVPAGWLWARITAAALRANASITISRG